MTPNKLRIANSLMSDIDMCKHVIALAKIRLQELLNKGEDSLEIRVTKKQIAIEEDKQAALEKEFRNL